MTESVSRERFERLLAERPDAYALYRIAEQEHAARVAAEEALAGAVPGDVYEQERARAEAWEHDHDEQERENERLVEEPVVLVARAVRAGRAARHWEEEFAEAHHSWKRRGEELKSAKAERDGLRAQIDKVRDLRDEYRRDDNEHLSAWGQHHPVAGIAADHLSKILDAAEQEADR